MSELLLRFLSWFFSACVSEASKLGGVGCFEVLASWEVLNEWMNVNLYIAIKKLPRKTLRVHSARYWCCVGCVFFGGRGWEVLVITKDELTVIRPWKESRSVSTIAGKHRWSQRGHNAQCRNRLLFTIPVLSQRIHQHTPVVNTYSMILFNCVFNLHRK